MKPPANPDYRRHGRGSSLPPRQPLAANRHHRAASERGSLLVWVFAVNAALLILIIGYFPFFQTLLRSTQTFPKVQGELLAEMGIERALYAFNDVAAINASPGTIVNWTNDGWINISGTAGCTALGGTTCLQRNLIDANYDNPFNSPYGGVAGDATVTVVNPVALPPNYPVVVSIGSSSRVIDNVLTAGGNWSTTQQIRAVLRRNKPEFSFAAYAGDHVKMAMWGDGGVQTDSYNSTNGPYGGANIASNGHVGCQDCESMGPSDLWDFGVQLGAKATVKGNLQLKVGSPVTGTGTVTGSRVIKRHGIDFPQIVIPQTLQNLTSEGTLIVNTGTTLTLGINPQTGTCDHKFDSLQVYQNATLTLPPGCRVYTSDPTVFFHLIVWPGTGGGSAGGGQIVAQGQNTMYIDGYMEDDGEGFVNTHKPEDLQIYHRGLGGPGDVSFFNQAQPFNGVMYQTNKGIWFECWNYTGDCNAYGSFVGEKGVLFQQGGLGEVMRIHYDEALKGLALDSTGRNGPAKYRIDSLQRE